MLLPLFFVSIIACSGFLFGAQPKSLAPNLCKAAQESKPSLIKNKKTSGLRVKSLFTLLVAAVCITSPVMPVTADDKGIASDILRAVDDARVIHCKFVTFGLGWYACERIRVCGTPNANC